MSLGIVTVSFCINKQNEQLHVLVLARALSAKTCRPKKVMADWGPGETHRIEPVPSHNQWPSPFPQAATMGGGEGGGGARRAWRACAPLTLEVQAKIRCV